MKIPLTVLSHNINFSVERLHPRHREAMYEVGLEELKLVSKRCIKFTHSSLISYEDIIRRWAGRERFLYEYINALGAAIDSHDHLELKEDFESLPDYTKEVPNWVGARKAFRRHIAQLMFWDDFDRLNARWITKRREDVVPDYREDVGSGPEVFGALMRAGRNVTGCNFESFTNDNIRRILSSYPLYQITSGDFFRRNRYRSLVSSYRRYERIPYIQRNASDRQLTGLLRERARASQNDRQERARNQVREFVNTWGAAVSTMNDSTFYRAYQAEDRSHRRDDSEENLTQIEWMNLDSGGNVW